MKMMCSAFGKTVCVEYELERLASALAVLTVAGEDFKFSVFNPSSNEDAYFACEVKGGVVKSLNFTRLDIDEMREIYDFFGFLIDRKRIV